MKSIKVKKILATMLAASMVMASAVTVSASSNNPDPGVSPSESSSSSSESSSSSSQSSSSSSESSGSVTYAQTMSKSANAPVSVAGTSVRTSVAGVYAAEKVQGVAVVTPLSTIKTSLGLTGNQNPAIVIYDTDAKKSHLAMDCVNAAAGAIGGTVVATMNIDLGAKENGKWVRLSSGSVGLVAGLPKGADTSKTYCAICVQPGGIVTILEDQDSNPATVTFEVQAGLGTYAITAK